MSGWSCWKNIEQHIGCKAFYVYKIRLIDPNGKAIAIPRFLSKDNEGLIYIGKSPTVSNDRLNRFKNVIVGIKDTHSAAEGYLLIKDKITKKYGKHQIQYSYRKLDNKEETDIEEKRLLDEYFQIYGGFPPLNRKRG